MLYRLNETDPDRSGNVSVSNNTDLATAIDKNKKENPTLQTAVLPSPEEQQRQKSGTVAHITVDASKSGADAVKQANTLMNTNPAIRNAVNQGTAQIDANLGRGNSSINEERRKQLEDGLRRQMLQENTKMEFDGNAFREYLDFLRK